MATPEVRVVDLEAVLAARDGARAGTSGEGGEHTWARGGGEVARLCAEVAESLRSTGCVVVRDPRVAAADNARFLDMMERYFAQDAELKMAQARPELHYQVRDSAPLVWTAPPQRVSIAAPVQQRTVARVSGGPRVRASSLQGGKGFDSGGVRSHGVAARCRGRGACVA